MSRIEGTHVAGVLAVVLALLLPNAATAQTSRTIYDAHGRVQSRKWEVQEDLSRGTNTPSNISLRHTLRDLASYQQDFYRYIDDAKAVSFKDIGNELRFQFVLRKSKRLLSSKNSPGSTICWRTIFSSRRRQSSIRTKKYAIWNSFCNILLRR